MRDSGTFPDQNEGLTLLVKLFDDYQMKVRRQFSVNPLAWDVGIANVRAKFNLQNDALPARHLGSAVRGAWSGLVTSVAL